MCSTYASAVTGIIISSRCPIFTYIGTYIEPGTRGTNVILISRFWLPRSPNSQTLLSPKAISLSPILEMNAIDSFGHLS